MSRASELRVARARVQLIAEQLRAPSSPGLARAIALLEAAARRIEAEADAAASAEPIHFRPTGKAVRAVVSGQGSYIEYDDGTRVARS